MIPVASQDLLSRVVHNIKKNPIPVVIYFRKMELGKNEP